MADQPAPETMNRRNALRNMSLVLGVASSVPALAGLSAEAVLAQGKSIHEHVPAKPAAGPTANPRVEQDPTSARRTQQRNQRRNSDC